MKQNGATNGKIDPLEDRGREPAASVFDPPAANAAPLTTYGTKARREPKPWGYELVWAHTSHYAGKILWIRRGGRLSFQFHERKHESIYLLSGTLELELEGEDGQIACHTARRGELFHVPACRRHRLRALTDCRILEVSTPELDDIVRLQDDYGRC